MAIPLIILQLLRKSACIVANGSLEDFKPSAILSFDGLMKHFQEQVDRSTFGKVRRRLTLRHKEIMESGIGNRLDTFRAQMVTGRQRVSDWAKDIGKFDALVSGLAKTYSRGREAIAAAYDDPSSERFHEWPKRTKYHWCHHWMNTMELQGFKDHPYRHGHHHEVFG